MHAMNEGKNDFPENNKSKNTSLTFDDVENSNKTNQFLIENKYEQSYLFKSDSKEEFYYSKAPQLNYLKYTCRENFILSSYWIKYSKVKKITGGQII